MKKKKVYLSFPIGSRDIEKLRNFSAARAAFLSDVQGYEVFNPLDNGLPQSASWREHMKQDFKIMLECDAVFFCKDWQASCGCQLEHSVAIACGLELIYESAHWIVDEEK